MGEIASAHVTIYPKFASGFGSGVKNEVGKVGTSAGAKFNSGFNTSVGKSGGLGGAAVGVLKAGLAGIAAGASFSAISGGFKSVTGAASDLNETVNKAKVIFGDNYAAMDVWSSGAATSLGMSKQAALEASAGFGNMFTQLGFTGEAAAQMSQDVIQMATDMGSFNNLPTAEVADMISAAFRGEYDSLQRLVPTINAAAVEQEAMAMTGKKNAKELTQQEKAAATMALVTKGAAVAMGDFEKTADGMANKSKINAARVEELKAAFGGLMGPIQEVTNGGFEALITVGEKFTAWLAKNPAVIEGFAAGLSLVGSALKGLAALAVPVFAALVEGFAGVLDGVAGMLLGLSQVPGFEWASDAAAKVQLMADGAHAAAGGLADLSSSLWGAQGASAQSIAAIKADVDGLKLAIDSTSATVTINGDSMPVDQIAQTVIDNIDASTGTVTINGEPVPAEDALNYIIGQVNAGNGTITIDGNPEPANSATNGAVGYANGQSAAISVGANTSSADLSIGALINRINASSATVKVGTSTTSGSWGNGGVVHGMAAGGTVPGWSPNDRADNIPAWLTANEFVQPVAAVEHYGRAAMEAIRHKKATISYGDGGSVTGPFFNGDGNGTNAAALAAAVRSALDGARIELGGANAFADSISGRVVLAAQRRAGVR